MGFKRNFNDWEIDGVDSFLHLLESYIPTRKGDDRIRWKLRCNRNFTVRSFYETLWGSSSVSFLLKAVWRVKASRRVSFFVWTMALGKILNCD